MRSNLKRISIGWTVQGESPTVREGAAAAHGTPSLTVGLPPLLPDTDRSFRPFAALLIVLLAATIFCGCNRGTDSGNDNHAPATVPSPRKPLTAFERDLEYVRTGRFTHIYVIARKDGGVIEKDDIAYLKQNTPPETNQWVTTDENRRVIAGTNFVFTPENLDALRKRFNVEDYSGR